MVALEEHKCSMQSPELVPWGQKCPMVYKLTFPNGKSYIGQALYPRRRIWEHKTNKSGKYRGQDGLPLHRAITKYGWNHVSVEGIKMCREEDLDAVEMEMIRSHDSIVPNGYNIQVGGTHNLMLTPKVRERWEESMLQQRPQAVQTRMEKREAALDQMDAAVASKLREQLDQLNSRQQAQRRGETPPDHRFGPNEKRRAFWEARALEKMASMTPSKAAKYQKRRESSKKYAATRWKNKEQQTPARVQYMKEYRARRGKKVSLKDVSVA